MIRGVTENGASSFSHLNPNKCYAGHKGRSLFLIGLFRFCRFTNDLCRVRMKII